jgi:hypothetical protein
MKKEKKEAAHLPHFLLSLLILATVVSAVVGGCSHWRSPCAATNVALSCMQQPLLLVVTIAGVVAVVAVARDGCDGGR